MKSEFSRMSDTWTDDHYVRVYTLFMSIYRLGIVHTSHQHADTWRSTDDFIYKFVWYNDQSAG